MIRGGFLSVEGWAHLEALVRRPSEKHGVARRANEILLLDDGMSCEAVARVLYLDDDTVSGCRQRVAADVDGVKVNFFDSIALHGDVKSFMQPLDGV